MFVDIIITGRMDIDPGDLNRLKKESVSTLGAVLQNTGREVETQIIEVKEEQAAEDKPKTAKPKESKTAALPVKKGK